ncbi:MAG TPA: peroxiredoxin [Bdellovibrionota bacterium]|jgi:peroxiredoxin Q/BCP|nr:peroxiredoxin [Bdellovibrionota bacterium]
MTRKKVTARKKKITKKKLVKTVAIKNKVSKKKITKKAVTKKVAAKKVKKVTKKTSAKKTAKAAKSGVHPWIGKKVPALSVHLVQAGRDAREANLQELTASGVTVLYFYPKDDTPGCTVEACEFGDRIEAFTGIGAQVIGVSPDNEASHLKFIQKFNLPFALVSDTEKTLCNKMNLWKEKKFMGKAYMGVERSTFLLKDGFVVHAWQPVNVAGHVAEVQAKIAELRS